MTPTDDRVLGIDLGNTTGWAVVTADRAGVTIGEWDLRPRRFEGGGMRYLRFLRLLEDALRDVRPKLVAYEEVRRHIGTDASHVYGGFLSQLCVTCERLGVPYLGIPVSTVKRFATGRGNAGKDEVIAAAKRFLDGRGAHAGELTHNSADALFVALSALPMLGRTDR